MPSLARARAIRCGQFLLAVIIGLCRHDPAAAQNVLLYDAFRSGPLDRAIWALGSEVYKDPKVPLDDRVFYSPDAISVHNGLKLGLRQRTAADGQSGVPFRYVTGRIQSRQSFLYGSFDFVARLPAGRGLWPALWLRTPPPSPLNGEIDIIEGYGSRSDLVQSTLHPWHDGHETHSLCAMLSVRPGKPGMARSPCSQVIQPIQGTGDLSTDFHMYSIIWAPGEVTWLFDGIPYYAVAEEVPDQPMVVVMTLHLSAYWDGLPDASLHLPAVLEIDAVRVTGAGQP